MPWTASVLVIANVTATSDEVLGALERRAAEGPTTFTLLVPPSDSSAAAQVAAEQRLDDALDRMREHGLRVTGKVVDTDPITAVLEEFDPRRFDEIIVVTFPVGTSKWLQVDLPHRIERITAARVNHIVAKAPRERPGNVSARPEAAHSGLLSPLRVLTWGGHR